MGMECHIGENGWRSGRSFLRKFYIGLRVHFSYETQKLKFKSEKQEIVFQINDSANQKYIHSGKLRSAENRVGERKQDFVRKCQHI